MTLINKLLVKLFSKKVGEDEFGNNYYLGFLTNHLGKNKRFVIYNGLDLTSKVPPMWHAWLHYMIEEIPSQKNLALFWQKDYKPNLTGTGYAYKPSIGSDRSPVYNKWSPN